MSPNLIIYMLWCTSMSPNLIIYMLWYTYFTSWSHCITAIVSQTHPHRSCKLAILKPLHHKTHPPRRQSADLSKVYLEGFSACLVIPLLNPPQASKFRAGAGGNRLPNPAGCLRSALIFLLKFLDRILVAFRWHLVWFWRAFGVQKIIFFRKFKKCRSALISLLKTMLFPLQGLSRNQLLVRFGIWLDFFWF